MLSILNLKCFKVANSICHLLIHRLCDCVYINHLFMHFSVYKPYVKNRSQKCIQGKICILNDSKFTVVRKNNDTFCMHACQTQVLHLVVQHSLQLNHDYKENHSNKKCKLCDTLMPKCGFCVLCSMQRGVVRHVQNEFPRFDIVCFDS